MPRRSCSALAGAALALALGLPAGAQDWLLSASTGLRLEGGGDAGIGERADGSRTSARRASARVVPQLRWARRAAFGSVEAQLAPAIEVPPRRSGHALSGAAAQARLGGLAGATRLALDLRAHRVAFAPASRWSGRDRLSAVLSAERDVRLDLSLSAACTFEASRYGVGSTSAEPTRRDGRQRARVGALWHRDGWWTAASAEAVAAGSSQPAYAYRGAELHGAAGLARGRAGLAIQASREWRRYGGAQLPSWRLNWVGARVSWRLSPSLQLYAGAQREAGVASGRDLFEPWRLVETGLRFDLPLAAPAVAGSRRAPRCAGLAPQAEAAGWVFRYRADRAHSVHLVGSFSAWDPAAHPMRRGAGGGVWETVLELPPGIYEYAFLVDGQDWRAPPAAAQYVDDGFGRQNGVLVVAAEGSQVR